jgi:hypothetical protein
LENLTSCLYSKNIFLEKKCIYTKTSTFYSRILNYTARIDPVFDYFEKEFEELLEGYA